MKELMNEFEYRQLFIFRALLLTRRKINTKLQNGGLKSLIQFGLVVVNHYVEHLFFLFCIRPILKFMLTFFAVTMCFDSRSASFGVKSFIHNSASILLNVCKLFTLMHVKTIIL